MAAELDRVIGLRTRSALDNVPLMDRGGVLSEPESDLVRNLLPAAPSFFCCSFFAPSEVSLDSGLSILAAGELLGATPPVPRGRLVAILLVPPL